MSSDSLNFSLDDTYGSNKRLLIHYDFTGEYIRTGTFAWQEGLNYQGYIPNEAPANNIGIWSGKVLGGLGSTFDEAINRVTGGDAFLSGSIGRLDQSNVEVSTAGPQAINYDSVSAVFDMQYTGMINSPTVLFGSLEKTSTTINGITYTGSKGFNFGVTKRGHLFYQSFDSNGDFIHSFKSTELSKRSVVAFSHGKTSIGLHRFDMLNNRSYSEYLTREDFPSMANSDSFFLGGSKNWYKNPSFSNDGSSKTSSLNNGPYLNSFALLSGEASPSSLFSIASGLVGEYSITEIPRVLNQRITGYQQEIIYKTGITGYDYTSTGSISLATGRNMFTGNFFGASTVNTGEGDRYFLYRSFDDALSASGVKTFVKEEVGYLHPNSGYQYSPTGENAFDTLGLQNVDGAVTEYIEQRGISGAATVGVTLFGSLFLTGVTSGISGVRQVPKYETIVEREARIESGISISVPANLFKKNFIYYLGERL